jgi:hypothetical protein
MLSTEELLAAQGFPIPTTIDHDASTVREHLANSKQIDVRAIADAFAERNVEIAWFSPSCAMHSKAGR